MKLRAAILIKLRNFVWEIRRRWDKDAFEKGRDDWCCGMVYEYELLNLMLQCSYGKPDMDCALQYEEKGQAMSMHWYLDKKYQLHARFFNLEDPDVRAYSVHAHVEIRPDYDPIAHIKGKELVDGCSTFTKIYNEVRAKAIERDESL